MPPADSSDPLSPPEAAEEPPPSPPAPARADAPLDRATSPRTVLVAPVVLALGTPLSAAASGSTTLLTAVDPTAAGFSAGFAVLALTCIGIAALGAHAGAALLVHSPTKLQKRYKAPHAVLDELQQNRRELIVLCRLLLIGGVIGALLSALAAGSGATGTWTLLATALGVAFGAGVVPSAIAEARAEAILWKTLPLLRAMRVALRWPLLQPLDLLSRWLLGWLAGPTESPTDPEEIADEILAAVTDSVGQDGLAEEERRWIENIVELKDLTVSDAMTPRTDVVAFEASLPLTEAVRAAIQDGHSRYPVYEGNIDNVVGVFYAKDALAHLSGVPQPAHQLAAAPGRRAPATAARAVAANAGRSGTRENRDTRERDPKRVQNGRREAANAPGNPAAPGTPLGATMGANGMPLTAAPSRGDGGDTTVAVRALMRPPLFVPESMAINELLHELKASKVQMAIVLDEYGGTAGVITFEDLLEEIVGDIADEYDVDEESPLEVVEPGRVLEVSGRARIDEVGELLGVPLPEGEYETIGGFVFSHLGRIPAAGETFEVEHLEFTVLRAHARRVGRLRITLLVPHA